MTQYVTDAAGQRHRFPDEATPEMIAKALGVRVKPRSNLAPMQAVYGFNEALANIYSSPQRAGTELYELGREALLGPRAPSMSGLIRGEKPWSALESFGRPVSETPEIVQRKLKPDFIEQFLRQGPQPTGLTERVLRGAGHATGETAMMLPFFGLAAQLAKQGAGMVPRVVRAITQPMTQAPAKGIAAELTAGGGAGAGGQLAREIAPGDTGAEMLGELSGGMATVAAPSAMLLSPTRWALRGARSMLLPFTKAGARPRAEKRVQGLVADPARAGLRLDQPVIAMAMTPATRTGESSLMALEKEVVNTSAKLRGQYAERTRAAVEQLRDAVKDVGGPIPPRAMAEATALRRDYLIRLMDTRVAQAMDFARQRLDAMQPRMRMSAASIVQRQELDAALAAARAQRQEFWGAVPMDLQVAPDAARGAYANLLSLTPRAQWDDIPAKAKQFLDADSNEAFGATESVREVWGLRSALLEEERAARAAGQWNKARITGNIADALLADLEALKGKATGDVGESLRVALDYSADMAKRFHQGTVGRILGYERVGGPSVAPDMTLETALGTGGTRGFVAAQQMRAAAGTPQTEVALEQHMLNLFQRQATKSGQIVPEAAQNFMRDNADMLDTIPGLRQRITGAIEAQTKATISTKRAEASGKALYNQRKSYTEQYLGARLDEEFDRVVKDQNPIAFAQELRRQADRDKTGRALGGLQAAAVDYLMRAAKAGTDPETGVELLSGQAMRNALKDRNTRTAFSMILSPEKIARLDKIADEFILLERARGPLPKAGGIIQDVPARLLSLIVTTLGARHGAALGKGTSGASLKMSAYVSGQAKELLTNLTRDRAKEMLIEAVTADSPELMQTLLMTTSKTASRRVAVQRLNAWLAQPGMTLLEGGEEEHGR